VVATAKICVAARRTESRRVGARPGRPLAVGFERTFGCSSLRGGTVRVLGVDPGLTRCGLGVVDGQAGRRLAAVAYDVVCTPASDDVAMRLLSIERQIGDWIERHQPDVVAVERVFSQHNVRTVMGTAQAAAVAITTAARAGIPVVLHTPSEVKAAVTGSGRADKAQVGAMVTRLLGLGAVPRPADTADALALAICHIWRGSALARLEQQAAAQRSGLARAVAP
jgi:crossover junction endodeoxyribonuclease RuvC